MINYENAKQWKNFMLKKLLEMKSKQVKNILQILIIIQHIVFYMYKQAEKGVFTPF